MTPQIPLHVNEYERPVREIIKEQTCRKCKRRKSKLYRAGICEDCILEFEL